MRARYPAIAVEEGAWMATANVDDIKEQWAVVEVGFVEVLEERLELVVCDVVLLCELPVLKTVTVSADKIVVVTTAGVMVDVTVTAGRVTSWVAVTVDAEPVTFETLVFVVVAVVVTVVVTGEHVDDESSELDALLLFLGAAATSPAAAIAPAKREHRIMKTRL